MPLPDLFPDDLPDRGRPEPRDPLARPHVDDEALFE
jgi:hypothetical protein